MGRGKRRLSSTEDNPIYSEEARRRAQFLRRLVSCALEQAIYERLLAKEALLMLRKMIVGGATCKGGAEIA